GVRGAGGRRQDDVARLRARRHHQRERHQEDEQQAVVHGVPSFPCGQQRTRTVLMRSPGPTKTTMALSPTRPVGISTMRPAGGPKELESVANRRSRSPNFREEPSASPIVYSPAQYATEVTWRLAGA